MRSRGRLPLRRLLLARGGSALSTRFAEERNRVLGQELAKVDDRAHADLLRMAKERKVDASKKLKVLPPVQMDAQPKDVADTRWVLTWKEVGGKLTATERLVAKG